MANRFDAACGMYWWLAEHHEGQGSDKYRRLSRMSYTPGPLEKGPSDHGSVQVYNNACDREGCEHAQLTHDDA